jgi:putative endonuclease
MDRPERPPAGPRGLLGAAAEEAAADHLAGEGWSVVARNVRLGDDEIDIVALEPGSPPTVVVVEVRSRSGPRYGTAVESVDARKVARLYRASRSLRRAGHPAVGIGPAGTSAWRVDLLALRWTSRDGWVVEAHLRGLTPP